LKFIKIYKGMVLSCLMLVICLC